MNQRMTGFGSGVLLRVANLDAERYFFRNILQLGEPLVDSSFWVEFSAPDGTRIVLEHSEASFWEHGASATAILLAFPDAEKVCAVLREANIQFTSEPSVHPGEAFYRTVDPEGNIIYFGNAFNQQ